MSEILFAILDENAKLPSRAHSTDSGIDIYNKTDSRFEIKPQTRQVIPTGVSFRIPEGYDLILKPKSGYAINNGIHTLGGVVDQEYQGQIKVCLYNSDLEETFVVEPGQKICQAVCRKVETFPVVQIKPEEATNISSRGTQGFGSTGNF